MEYHSIVEKIFLDYVRHVSRLLNLLQEHFGDSISTQGTNDTEKYENHDDESVSFRIFILLAVSGFLCFQNRWQMKLNLLNRRRKIGMTTTMK